MLKGKLQKTIIASLFSILLAGAVGCYNDSDSSKPLVNPPSKTEIDTGLKLIDTYALWPGEKRIKTTAESFSKNTGEITEVLWDMDESDGIDFDNPDATGLIPDYAYEKGGYYSINIKVISEEGIEEYRTALPVAEVYKMGMPDRGNFSTFDFLEDGRIAGLCGSAVKIQKEKGSQDFDDYFKFTTGCDPAFIIVKADNNTILVGAGDAKRSLKSIWQVKLSDYKGTVIELTPDNAMIQLPHFSGALLDENTLVIDGGEIGSGSWIDVLNISTNPWKKTRRILTKENAQSGGVMIDDQKNVYVSTALDEAGNRMIRFSYAQVQAAIEASEGNTLTLDDGELVLNNEIYRLYSTVQDNKKNVFISGSIGSTAYMTTSDKGPGYFSLSDMPAGKEDIKPVFHVSTGDTDPGYKGIVNFAAENDGYIGWSMTTDWINYSFIVVPFK